MFAPINCLMWTGDTINDDLRNLLFNTAQDMLAGKTPEAVIKTDWCEGPIQTKFEIKGIGSTFGYKFDASIDWGNKHTKIEFIIKEQNIRFVGMRWIDATPDDIISRPDANPTLN